MHRHHAPGDPLEGFNRGLFSVHQALDRTIFRPIALGYKSLFPKPLRSGLRHFFSNLTEPIVFINDMLQLKPAKAVRTVARFVINSTAGIGGLVDVAKTAKLPHHDNGLGNTLGRYGIGPGPYLFLPLIGPTDLRDLLGGQIDRLVLPVIVGKPFNRFEYQLAEAVVTGLDARARADGELKALLDGAADPYATLRSVYLQNRAAEVDALSGHAGSSGALDDPLLDPEAPPSGATPPQIDTPPDPEAAAPGATPPAIPLQTDTPPDPEAPPISEPQPPAPSLSRLSGAALSCMD